MSQSLFTLVVGVDAKHLEQLLLVWPTWKRHKPELLDFPMLLFWDRESFSGETPGYDIARLLGRPLEAVPWPPPGVSYGPGDGSRWTNPQREKMLSGFVHVPAAFVRTPYWLKLDTDTVATGNHDWLLRAEEQLAERPAILAQKWSYTKPADQMLRLDRWAEAVPALSGTEPLGLAPPEGWSRVPHRRIISWCGFFRTDFTRLASRLAAESCGLGRLPVPSQDGYLWYLATRLGEPVARANFKRLGWKHRSTTKNVRASAEEAMRCPAD